jgi:uncharacterized cupin superfamily protein|tara:strand:+ start:1471 stop:1743 length:273 start_codon:yes stop_codon:yes gene_type:complete
MEISIDSSPSESKLQSLNVFKWPIWTKEISEFPWEYDVQETCYFLNGEVIVTPENQSPVKLNQGDLVIFPAGMKCTWKIVKDVKKHYKFG